MSHASKEIDKACEAGYEALRAKLNPKARPWRQCDERVKREWRVAFLAGLPAAQAERGRRIKANAARRAEAARR